MVACPANYLIIYSSNANVFPKLNSTSSTNVTLFCEVTGYPLPPCVGAFNYGEDTDFSWDMQL